MSTRPRHLKRFVLLVVLPVLAVAAALFFWLQGGRYATTENAFVKADIAQIASEVAGRVLDVPVRDHAVVTTGDILVRLDPAPYRLALARAEAEVDAARTQVEQLKASLRETRAEAREAGERLAFLEQQAERQRDLSARGVSPAIRLEQADSDVLQARSRLAMLHARIARVEAALGGDPERPTDAAPEVREKKALRDRAALDLAHTVIRAPRDGMIANLRLQPGEQVRPQVPLFSVVSDQRPWIEANFKETDLTFVVVGQRAEVAIDMYPGLVWEAEVESISPATGAEFAILPPQNASGNWVKVVQRLPVRLRLVGVATRPPLRAGMTAYVSIDTERRRTLASLLGERTAAATYDAGQGQVSR